MGFFNYLSFILSLIFAESINYPVQTPYLGKFFFWSYSWKSSQSIILQDYLFRYISRWNQLISWIFCIWTDCQKRKTSNVIFLIRWPGMLRDVQTSTWAQRLSKSNSFTRHISKSSHTFLVHRLSQQSLLSNQIVGFVDVFLDI